MPRDPAWTADLPGWRRPLAVVAHPDDESFGLGAVLSAFVDRGARPAVLCFTHGEASTLHGVQGDLRQIRAGELAAAAQLLGLGDVLLLDEADGSLASAGPGHLAAAVRDTAERGDADGLIAFDLGGITGHPDHVAATRAAIDAGTQLGLPVLGWVLPEAVAVALAEQYGMAFQGRRPEDIDLVVPVRRDTQLAAVRAHPSQAVPGSALWHRLDLLGGYEYLAWLTRPR